MPWSSEEIFKACISTLEKMLETKGKDYKFPTDAIWLNMPESANVDVNIPGTARSPQANRLLKAGYLDLTGGLAKAHTKQGAGSVRKEYRFGPKLVPPISEAPRSSTSSPSERLKDIQVAMDAEGYMITPAELANFYLAMAVSPLVILSGISGTGKSLLPRKFAKLTGSAFMPIPVQPQWSDNSDLLGYVPTLSPTTYVNGALTKSLLEAKKNPSKLVIALLDEMNLAQVEHYFSDFLSVVESRARVNLEVITDELPIDLPIIPVGSSDPYAELRGIRIPPNLRVVGTANMDESTKAFSPKVLDRAFTIELDDPTLTDFSSPIDGEAKRVDHDQLAALAGEMIQKGNAISIREASAKSQSMFDHIAGLLAEIQDILSPSGIKFGYRTRDAILLYLHFWRQHQLQDIMAGYAALDFCILQKILPKVTGSGDALADALKKLVAWFKEREMPQEGDPFPEFTGKLERCVDKVERMAVQLDQDGVARFWGA